MEQPLMGAAVLPIDHERAVLVGRAWLPGEGGGPAVVTLRGDRLVDCSGLAPTMSDLIDLPDPAAAVRAWQGPAVGPLAGALQAAAEPGQAERLRLLAPVDLQAIKAAGVTFARSTLERVIEERARGDFGRAAELRSTIEAALGGEIRTVRPGSDAAQRLKIQLQAAGVWSQYLEVAIGPDPEIFTKAQPMSAVGTGAEIGILRGSSWNNPEPEIVLAVSSRGVVQGATLGNDVNLRDYEGRSALLLSKAKDNNGSCAIGPFIRLFDAAFGMAAVRRAEVRLGIEGADGFRLSGASSMAEISRDPDELVAHTLSRTHQYPDGFVLFLGTMFAPTQDRKAPGQGFTHEVGDIVTIAADQLGSLVNRVALADEVAPWTFGVRALMGSLAQRGLLRRGAVAARGAA